VKLTTRSRGEIEAAPDPRGLDNFCRTNSVSNLSATATLAGEPNLTAALNLAAAGLPVFPAGPDKRPLVAGWQEKATTEEEQIRKWWDTHLVALPAIVVGRAGLVVIDCDRHPGGKDGIEAFNRLLSANDGNLADVPMTRTARSGAHLFFKQPIDEPLGNRRGELPEGIDVRGVGGFVIAPGAVLPNGQSWRPINGTPLLAEALKAGTIPELPLWLADIIRRNRKPNGQGIAPCPADMPGTDSSLRGQAYAAAALDGVGAELSATPNGKRNQTLNAVAFRMGRLIAREWIDEKTVADALLGACDANKYLREHGHRATIKTIESGIEAGRKEPHPDLPDREPSSGDDGTALSDLSDLSAIGGAKQRTGDEQQARGRKAETGTWEEPDWALLDDRRGELPDFPVEALPASLRGWLLPVARL
jgi:bifunctional DNA primase/polymerase-like protein